MSGPSRIGGYGGYPDSGGRRDRSVSLARFRRGRKQGDVVSGVFVRRETEALGWALLEGEELLAHLPEDWGTSGTGPVPGDRVFFRVEALAPEVVLRMLTPTDPLARLAAILPSVPLAQEAVLYVAARDRLDAALSASGNWDSALLSTQDVAVRERAFIDLAAANPSVLAAFAETAARARSLCRAGASAGLVFFRHMPWLGPGLDQVEVSLWRDEKTPVIAGARLISGEKLLLRGEMREGIFRYRLSIAGPTAGGGRFSPGRTAASEYLGAVPGGASGVQTPDLVGRILALAADSGAMAVGRFSRKL